MLNHNLSSMCVLCYSSLSLFLSFCHVCPYYCLYICPQLCLYVSLCLYFYIKPCLYIVVIDRRLLLCEYYKLATRSGMMATHGSLSKFADSQENWMTYVERLEQYYTANDIAADAKERHEQYFCHHVVQQRTNLCNLLAPKKPAEAEYKDIVQALTTHYNPNPSQIAKCFKFNSRVRHHGESIAAFVTDLRRLTEHCGYGVQLDEMIRH